MHFQDDFLDLPKGHLLTPSKAEGPERLNDLVTVTRRVAEPRLQAWAPSICSPTLCRPSSRTTREQGGLIIITGRQLGLSMSYPPGQKWAPQSSSFFMHPYSTCSTEEDAYKMLVFPWNFSGFPDLSPELNTITFTHTYCHQFHLIHRGYWEKQLFELQSNSIQQARWPFPWICSVRHSGQNPENTRSPYPTHRSSEVT